MWFKIKKILLILKVKMRKTLAFLFKIKPKEVSNLFWSKIFPFVNLLSIILYYFFPTLRPFLGGNLYYWIVLYLVLLLLLFWSYLRRLNSLRLKYIYALAYKLRESDSYSENKSFKYYWLEAEKEYTILKLIKRALVWITWDFLSLGLIWQKIFPLKKQNGQSNPSTFFIWILGIHFAAFSIASSRYENRKDSLETRLTILVTQMAIKDSRILTISDISRIQRVTIPRQPSLFFLSSYRSLFGREVLDPEIVTEIKEIISRERYNLDNVKLESIDLSGYSMDNLTDLSNAKFRNSYFNTRLMCDEYALSSQLFLMDPPDLYLYNKPADLSFTDFTNSDLKGACLIGADLSNSELTGVNLTGADLQDTNLWNANIKKAILIGTKNLTFKQIKSTCFWNRAIYKGQWNEKEETWIVLKPDNNEFIEELKNDTASDLDQPIDCSY